MTEIEEQDEGPELHPVELAAATCTVQDWEGPQTHDEARCFHQGFLSGLTTYARESGVSTLKSTNDLLRRLMDEQGWKTVETYERLAAKQNALEFSELDGARCEHGIPEGDFCDECRQDYHIAANDPDNGVIEEP